MRFGWGAPIPWPMAKLASQVTRIKQEVEAAGRDPESLSFAAGLSFGVPDPAIELIGRYREAGITHLVVSTQWSTPEEYRDKLTWFAETVMAPLATGSTSPPQR